ncbi:HEAT repeat domain-containing protein [Thermodesulfobacterium hveragerdense]|uniref:HEAT repeat domain-containing protein n=1 Tax=Thermodesulfobacterium hveragerdense TaxID=53424 RepID=UPI000415FE5E|nr:HEAT repeat domain-containing protein [Thermodesulfobacterium hveragerdense]
MFFTVKVLSFIIFAIFSVNLFLVIYDFIRRFLTQIRYQRLDRTRNRFAKILEEIFRTPSADLSKIKPMLKTFSFSLEKQAFLETLLNYYSKFPEQVLLFAQELGFVEEYEKKLNSSKPYERGEAFRTLAILGSKKSLEKMLDALKKEDDPEVAFVGFLSCGKLLDKADFKMFLILLYEKQSKKVLNLRSVSLIITDFIDRFKEQASFSIYDFLKEQPISISFRMALLEGVYHPKHSDETLLRIAKEHLKLEHPEILAKALKVLSKAVEFDKEVGLEEILPFLRHPSWFVRFSALKVLENKITPEMVDYVTPLLEDKNALVRREAAKVLFKLPIEELIIKLPYLLEIKDPYGRDSLVEEMVMSGVWERLKEGGIKGPLKSYVENIMSFLQLNYKMA